MSDFDFDELLDQVLKEEARVEPRVGMERRILERVGSEERRPRRWWIPAGVFAAVAIAAVLMMQHGSRRPAFVIVDGPGVRHPSLRDAMNAAGVKEPVIRRQETRAETARVVRRVVPKRTPSREVAVADERVPKMDTFPAVTQKGSLLAGWRSGDAQSSGAAAQALLELKAEQERPLRVDAIEIKPL